MLSSLSAGRFAIWFSAAAALIACGTVFFGQLLGLIVPALAVGVCEGSSGCNAVGAFLGLRFKPLMLLAGALVAAVAFLRRGRAVGSPLWALFPLALIVPNFPSLFLLGREWGADYGIGLMFFPRWSFFELSPLLAAGLLFSTRFEHAAGYAGSIAATRLLGILPVGALYVVTCVWAGADLILAVLGTAGLPPKFLAELQWVLHYPAVVADGVLSLGLPIGGSRPDFVISLATLANLAAFALLAVALRVDAGGRRVRAARIGAILPFDDRGGRDRPLFPSGRSERT